MTAPFKINFASQTFQVNRFAKAGRRRARVTHLEMGIPRHRNLRELPRVTLFAVLLPDDLVGGILATQVDQQRADRLPEHVVPVDKREVEVLKSFDSALKLFSLKTPLRMATNSVEFFSRYYSGRGLETY